NVLLRTDSGRLRLTATNLEVGINCWVPAKVEDEGAITVPAKLFIDFVNSLPPGNVELSLNVRTKTVHIKAGPYEANIKGLDAEEFPIIPQIPDKPTKSQVIFHTDEADLVSRIIEGQFPNYRQVIPTTSNTKIVAQREELLKATRLASYFARDAANMLRFQVDPSSDPPLVISANAAEVGD